MMMLLNIYTYILMSLHGDLYDFAHHIRLSSLQVKKPYALVVCRYLNDVRDRDRAVPRDVLVYGIETRLIHSRSSRILSLYIYPINTLIKLLIIIH